MCEEYHKKGQESPKIDTQTKTQIPLFSNDKLTYVLN